MSKPVNKMVMNRTSPKNEDAYVRAYKEQNPKSNRKDGLDIAAVTTKDGTKGHALMPEKFNRSKDRDTHIGKEFIPDTELKKSFKK